MSTVDEYHKYARDCLRWAARARTEEQRRQFLTPARALRRLKKISGASRRGSLTFCNNFAICSFSAKT